MDNFYKTVRCVCFILVAFLFQENLYASHAQSADLTYRCLGGNQYELTLSFYRDCAGASAPTNVTINISSASCGENLSATLSRVAGTGNNVTPICATAQTVCTGGAYPGVQEYIFRGTVTLPQQCNDWVFSFSLCCRNAAINTINNPGGENIFVQARLDNLNFPCNSSPVFSNKPIPFVCAGEQYCFNHGATDADGDSLVYSLMAPATGATTNVTYVNPYSATQPLLSNPAVSFNSVNGDICMTPSQLEVTVMAVKVEEWRNGVLIGSVVRDIQLRVIACNNNNPSITGISGTGNYTLTACAGTPITFTTSSVDADAAQDVTISWNNGIPGATFTSSGGSRPTGTFSWTPGIGDISANGHCFTVTVRDNNCPYNGSQTFAFCITVIGVEATATTTAANCNASNGSATVTTIGGSSPFTYQWLPNGGNGQTANGLSAGTYTFVVTDSRGCSFSDTISVANGGSPGNVVSSSTPASCFGGNNGTATINGNGGRQPYSYKWSSGSTAATATGLAQGVYQFSLTTANGCVTTGSVNVTQPSVITPSVSSSNNVLCTGGNTGSATIGAGGGTAPYAFLWSGSNATTASVSGLAAGTFSVRVTDKNGCTANGSVTITQPPQLIVATSNSSNVSCNGGNNGSVNVNTTGGIPPYSYIWSTGTGTSSAANNLPAGSYSVNVTDMNGCTAMASATVSQPSVLFSNVLALTNVSCFGGNDGNAVITVNGGTGPYNYTWSTSTGNNNTASSLSAGNYSVTVNDNNGCSTNGVIVITQPALLTASPGSITNVSCNGGSNGTASINAAGGIQPYTYQWQGNISNSIAANNLAQGVYSATVTDANGCKATTTATITQPSPLLATIPFTTSVSCFGGNNGSLTAQASGGISPYNFLWTNGATTAITSNLTAGQYNITINDANGCTLQISGTVTQPADLTINILNTKNISCFNGSDGGASVSGAGGTSPYNYSWTNTGITGPAIANLNAGSFQVMITDNNSCTAIRNVILTQPTVLSSTVPTITNVTCYAGNNGSATVSGTGGTSPYNYLWAHNNGSAATTTGLTQGNYSVRITDANGCINNSFITITQPTPVVTSLQAPGTICIGNILGLSAAATGGSGTGYSYNWLTMGGNTSTQYLSPTTTTTYSVTVTDNNGCQGDTSIATVIIYNLTKSNLTVTPDHGICYGLSTSLSAAVTGSTGNVTYSWNNALPNGAGPHNVSPAQTTSYIVTALNECDMAVEDTVTVTVYSLPAVALLPQSATGCDNATLNFTNNGAPYIQGAGYEWNFGDGSAANIFNPSHSYTQSGTYTVSLLVTSPEGCKESASTTCVITINVSPDAKFDVDRTSVSTFDPVIRFINLSENATSYLWDFGIEDSKMIARNQGMRTAVDPVITYDKKGNYPIALIARNNSGCMDTAQTIIEVTPEFTFYIPNSFTPNGDGVNDYFTAKGEEVAEFQLYVFDRWGGFIYSTKDMSKGWDGTVNAYETEIPGLIVQDGTYVYRIVIKDMEQKMHRFVGGVSVLK